MSSIETMNLSALGQFGNDRAARRKPATAAASDGDNPLGGKNE
jgi:hypothetical protein